MRSKYGTRLNAALVVGLSAGFALALTAPVALYAQDSEAAGATAKARVDVPDPAREPSAPGAAARNYRRDDWSDLTRADLYGSEKEEKFRINALVVEEEFWSDHYSLGILGLFRYTDYPAFRALNVLPFYSSLEAKHDDRRSRWIFPIYYSSFDGADYLQITPLSLRSYDTAGDGFGLYGFLYRNAREDGEISHTLFPIASWSRDTDGDRFALTVAPLFYTTSKPNAFTLLFPGIYYDKNADATTTASPLHYYHTAKNESRRSASFLTWLAYYSQSTETDADARDTLYINPLFYHHDRVRREGTDVAYRTTLWFPLPVPLHYRSDDSEGGRARLYGPVYYEHNRRGELEALIVAPLVFHRPGGYLYLPPLYFQTRHDSEGHRSMSPLHYAHIRNRNTPRERGLVWAGPYYRDYDLQTKRHFAHLAPLYFSWDTPESEFDLALPAYLRYRSATRYIHVNAAGLSISREKLPLPRLGISATDEWYFEQDIALFYNLFRLSTRVTPGAGQVQGDSPLIAPEAGFARDTPRSGDHDRGVSRENSRNYWGVQSLYGMVAYEQADTRRHFRILPLSWFTWDQATDNRVYMVPGAFLSYVNADEDEEYFALFPAFAPVYGHQRSGASFTSAYLGLAYIREYDAESETRQHSILWPIANFHSSPRRSGGRVLPLFWHRAERGADRGFSSTTVSPLYFSRTNEYPTDLTENGRTIHNRQTLRISPLFYASSNRFSVASNSTAEDRTLIRYESTLVLPAPGLYLRDSNRGSAYNWLGLAGLRYSKETDAGLIGAYLAPVFFYGERSYLHLAPFYFSTRNDDGTEIARFGPGYYYSRDGESESALVLPGLYRSRYGTETYTNLMLAASWEIDAEAGFKAAGFLPVFSHRSNQGDPERDSHTYVFPFYYGRQGYDRSLSLHFLPAVFSWYTPGRTKSDQGDFALFAAGLYIRRAPDYQRDNLLYLVDRQVTSSRRDEVAASTEGAKPGTISVDHVYSTYGLLFHSLSYASEPGANDFALGYGYLAGLSHHRRGKYNEGQFAANLLWLKHESRPGYTHNSFFPLWWYDHDSASSLWAFAPLLSGGRREGEETTRLFGGGALYYEFTDTARDEYSRAVLLGALYTDVRQNERGYRSRGSLWNYLWQFQEESESDFRKFSVLKFVYSKTRHAGKTRTRILGIRVHES